ncbi:MAG TPA: hypothetical protein VG097_20995 [Gemmata sp.]|nr:hypothetical protein [Gemmata sp.]
MRCNLRIVAICLGLAILTIVAFYQVVHCDFVDYDDQEYVCLNPDVLGGLTFESACWSFTALYAHNWHPLTWLSLQLDATIYGEDPAGYHLTNLLLHTGSAILLFLVLNGMTGCVWRSAVVAAFFSVHPLRVESVAWVSERKDVLSCFFGMLTLMAYLRYVRCPGWGRYICVIVAFTLGLMAKAMLVTLPCVFCLLDYWPLRRLSWSPAASNLQESNAVSVPRATLRLLIWEKLPLFSLSLISSLVTAAAQLADMGYLSALPWEIRAQNALITYASYLGQLFWPTNLCVFYPHPRESVLAWQSGAAGLLLLSVSALALIQLRKRPYLAVGWFWYLGMLVPVIGVIQAGEQARADRYTYLPMIGVLIMLAWGVPDLLRNRLRRVWAPVVCLLLAASAAATSLQVSHWRNSVELWEHAIAVDPGNAYAYYSLSSNYMIVGRIDDAIASARHAVVLEPEYLRFRAHLFLMLKRLGREEEANEERHQLNRLQMRPGVVGP